MLDQSSGLLLVLLRSLAVICVTLPQHLIEKVDASVRWPDGGARGSFQLTRVWGFFLTGVNRVALRLCERSYIISDWFDCFYSP